MSVLVLGDVLVDVIVHPVDSVLRDALSLNHIRAEIALSLGGSGFHLSNAIAELGAQPVYLASGIGADDVLNKFVREAADRVEDRGVYLILNTVPGATAGIAVIAYLDGDHERIMFADPGACNASWDEKMRLEIRARMASCELVVVSGHVLFREGSAGNTKWVLNLASQMQIPVALDLVPHSIHRRLSRQDLFRLLSSVSFVSADVNTLLAYAERPRFSEASPDDISLAIDTFLTKVDALTCFLPDLSRRLVDHSGSVEYPILSGDGGAKAGLTDRALASDLVSRYVRSAGSLCNREGQL